MFSGLKKKKKGSAEPGFFNAAKDRIRYCIRREGHFQLLNAKPGLFPLFRFAFDGHMYSFSTCIPTGKKEKLVSDLIEADVDPKLIDHTV
jgi:hypothetical protein